MFPNGILCNVQLLSNQNSARMPDRFEEFPYLIKIFDNWSSKREPTVTSKLPQRAGEAEIVHDSPLQYQDHKQCSHFQLIDLCFCLAYFLWHAFKHY